MHVLLAFLPRPAGGTQKIPRDWAEASDWFVLFTLGTLLFLLGAFAMWAWLIWRRTTKPEPHVQLLMELENATEREKDATPRTDDTEPNTPWAKSGDWWKKADD
jgi:hypothetical protein